MKPLPDKIYMKCVKGASDRLKCGGAYGSYGIRLREIPGDCVREPFKVWECYVLSEGEAGGKVKIPTVFDKITSVFIKIASVFDKITSVFDIF